MNALRLALLIGIGYMVYLALADVDENGESANTPDLLDYGAQVLDAGEEAVNGASEYFYGEDGMNGEQGMTANLSAFLVAIRYGEGTAAEDGYQILFGGQRFNDFSDHPALLGWPGILLSLAMSQAAGFSKQVPSTAAGAFQINRPTWKRVKAKLGLPDFSPSSQDMAAIQLIAEKGALSDIEAGRIDSAVNKVRKVWASLPSAGYGQHEVAMATFLSKYADAGGALA